jgi:hypothetical protein
MFRTMFGAGAGRALTQKRTGRAASFSCGEQSRGKPDGRETQIVKEPTPRK